MPQPPALIASLLTMTPVELDAWMEKALIYPGTPLHLDRDTLAYGALLDLARDAPQVIEVLQATCARCLEQFFAGRQMSLEVADDLLILALEWRIKSLGPTLLSVLQAPPQHPRLMRLRMMQILAEVADLPADFWLDGLTREEGALVSAAFSGLFKLDLELAISKLPILPPKVWWVWVVIEQFFEDHPEHRGLLPSIQAQLPQCAPRLRDALTEWLSELQNQA